LIVDKVSEKSLSKYNTLFMPKIGHKNQKSFEKRDFSINAQF